VQIQTADALVVDDYQENRVTGSFVLIDPVTNATVAAGMVGRAAFL
jgi:sulfate adenylyltransferase subunit 1 (EFTu-like GTPase family)